VALHPTPPHVATPPRTLPSILGSTSGMGDYMRQREHKTRFNEDNDLPWS
jgi:hypothetical protein